MTHPGRQALLEGSTDGQAAVVEVPDELRVNGAAELSCLSVSGSDEDPLDTVHQDVVKQGVLRAGGQSGRNRLHRINIYFHMKTLTLNIKNIVPSSLTYFMVVYISSVSLSVSVFFKVPR